MKQHLIRRRTPSPPPHRRGLPGGSLTIVSLLLIAFLPQLASAQTGFDEHGNLTGLPFEPDIPVVREAVQPDGDHVSFVVFTSLSYDETIEHYQEVYRRQRELAPGWTLAGHGFDVGRNAYSFTLRNSNTRFQLEIRPDEHSGGATLTIRSRAFALGFQPYLYSVSPFRAIDVGDIEF